MFEVTALESLYGTKFYYLNFVPCFKKKAYCGIIFIKQKKVVENAKNYCEKMLASHVSNFTYNSDVITKS